MGGRSTTFQRNLERATARGFSKTKQTEPVRRPSAVPSQAKALQAVQVWDEYLHVCELPRSCVPTESVCKNFLEYFVSSRNGRLEERMCCASMQSFWVHFVRGKGLSKAISSEIYNVSRAPRSFRPPLLSRWKYIAHNLDLSRLTRTKHLVSGQDIDNLHKQLWSHDATEFPYPRARVQQALWLSLEEASGQRGGTYIESNAYAGSGEALWYKDVRLYLERLRDGSTQFGMTIALRFLKGERIYAKELNGDNLVSIALYENELPFRNCVLLFIALAMADEAFEHCNSIQDVLKAKIRPGEKTYVFEWRNAILDKPVFQAIGHDGPTGRSATYSSMRNTLVNLGYGAGYQANITVHGIRRAFLGKVDKNYTPAQRNHIARHRGSDQLFQNRYLSNISVIDGQAIMHEQKPREDHISTLHSMLMQRRLDVPQQMPKEYKEKTLFASEAYQALDQELAEVNRSISEDRDNEQLTRRRTQIYKSKSKIKKRILKQYQAEWIKNRAGIVEDLQQKDEQESQDARAERSSIFRQFFPLRDRLARSLFQPANVGSPRGEGILDDLLSLCRMDVSVLYRPGEEPRDDRCPFNGCEKLMSMYVRTIVAERTLT